jgi:hypothetical protein
VLIPITTVDRQEKRQHPSPMKPDSTQVKLVAKGGRERERTVPMKPDCTQAMLYWLIHSLPSGHFPGRLVFNPLRTAACMVRTACSDWYPLSCLQFGGEGEG